MPMFARLPRWVILKINPRFSTFVGFKLVVLETLIISRVIELTFWQQLLSNIAKVAKSHNEGKDSKTVFDEISDSKLSAEDKQPLRLLQEAQTFSIAGTETTTWILSVRRPRAEEAPPSLSHCRKLTLRSDHDGPHA